MQSVCATYGGLGLETEIAPASVSTTLQLHASMRGSLGRELRMAADSSLYVRAS